MEVGNASVGKKVGTKTYNDNFMKSWMIFVTDHNLQLQLRIKKDGAEIQAYFLRHGLGGCWRFILLVASFTSIASFKILFDLF